MLTLAYQLADSCESLEVGLLGGHKDTFCKCGKHLRHQIPTFLTRTLVSCQTDPADEIRIPIYPDCVEQFSSVCVLAHRETRRTSQPRR